MPAASPICPSVRFSPDTGSVSLPAMLPTIVTSSPSRIQVTPRAKTTSQCHRLHGNRSILAGILVSTAWVAASPLLTLRLLSVDPDVIPQYYVPDLRYERPPSSPGSAGVYSLCTLWFGVQVTAHEPHLRLGFCACFHAARAASCALRGKFVYTSAHSLPPALLICPNDESLCPRVAPVAYWRLSPKQRAFACFLSGQGPSRD